VYRWHALIKGAEHVNNTFVDLLKSRLEIENETVWKDECNLDITASNLKEAVRTAMIHARVIIICLGPHDLKRCIDQEDFLRYEIDMARELESGQRVKVVVLVHGVEDWKDIFPDKLKKTRWAQNLMQYFDSRFILFYKYPDNIQDIITRLRSISDARRKIHNLV
jgi:hypothetical protein